MAVADTTKPKRTMMANYILDEQGNPVVEPDLMKWSTWWETSERIVKKNRIGDTKISTVFLGIDHQFDDGPPILYETMIFGGEHDEFEERYHNRTEALEGHARAVDLVLDLQDKKA